MPAERADRVVAYLGRMIDAAFRAAARAGQPGSARPLVEHLTRQGWQVRRTKVDGGCYEVYGTTPQGDRVGRGPIGGGLR